MGSNSKNWTKIDYDKLKAALQKRGVRVTEASIAIGRADNYIAGLKSSGKISPSSAILLRSIYGIDIGEYAYVEPEPEPEPAAPEKEQATDAHEETLQSVAAIDYDKLYKVILTACYRAMKKVELERKNK